jgi:hypothetical protein
MSYLNEWVLDVARDVYVNRRTGQIMPSSINAAGVGVAGGLWSSTGPPIRAASTDLTISAIMEAVQKETVEYAAMRTFLQHSYPEALKEFDIAFAAAKRMGVGDESKP